MWYAALLRFVRRRLVLAVIFCLSLTYCIVNLGKGSSLSSDADEYEIKRERPLIWLNDTNWTGHSCRNSEQGQVLIVDDRGFVCSRHELLGTGCCSTETKQFNCDTCSENHCCSIYENCVSCCLHPSKRAILERVIERASGRQGAVFASVIDSFELCLAKCRTDSHSVQHENKYRYPNTKYCYGVTKAHESQRDVIDENSV